MNIKEVVKLTGLTSKTLRHWEKVGLLTAERADNGYRVYEASDLTRIFYIMTLRQLELPLADIQKILSSELTEAQQLSQQLTALKTKQNQLQTLITTLENKLTKGDFTMTNKDFESFKAQQITDNMAQYGDEIREKYGNTRIDASNKKFQAQSEKELQWANDTHKKIVTSLETAFVSADETLADEIVSLHHDWLQYFWTAPVTPEAHIALGQMYVDDPRFRANYDRTYEGVAKFFAEAIRRHYSSSCQKDKNNL